MKVNKGLFTCANGDSLFHGSNVLPFLYFSYNRDFHHERCIKTVLGSNDLYAIQAPPSSILVHPLKSIFFDVSDDLEQKKIFFGTKKFLDLENFSNFFFFLPIFFSGSIMNANLTLYLPPSCSNLTA